MRLTSKSRQQSAYQRWALVILRPEPLIVALALAILATTAIFAVIF